MAYIKELMTRFLNEHKDNFAFSVKDGKENKDVTYREFTEDILRVAGWFRHNGIRGKHIAMIAANSYDWFVMLFAIDASGNTAVAMNPALPVDLLQWQCEKAEVDCVWAEVPFRAELQEKLPQARFFAAADVRGEAPITMDDVYEAAEDETVLLMFTSGTTGKSKVVEITSGNLGYSIENLKDIFDAGHTEISMLTIPMYHIAGVRCNVGMLRYCKTLCVGRGLMYLMADIPAFNPTHIMMVPAMVESIIKFVKRAPSRESVAKVIGNRLRRITVVGAVLRVDTARFLLNMGFMLDNVYGMTETTADGTWCLLDSEHIASIGKPCGITQCRIVAGEILLKSPANMKGYYHDPEETDKVLNDGWIHTGDMGSCDENGYIYITGRKKNIIILSNGENVCPEEIEEKLSGCEDVLECMVYSEPKGICADIYTENEAVVSEYVKQYNESMPRYRQIYKVNIQSEPLEKTGSGKIKRKENVYV